MPFLNSKAVGITVKKGYFGEGAERIVHELSEIDNENNLVGLPLVAKSSKYIINKSWKKLDNESFHKIFIKN